VVSAAPAGVGVDAGILAACLAWHWSNSQTLIAVKKDKKRQFSLP
jgi:hypothetical protein